MITITNKHIGLFVLVGVLSIPWIMWILGAPLFLEEKNHVTFAGVAVLLELGAMVIVSFVLFLHTMCRLLDPNHCNPIRFRWTIKLPTRNRLEAPDTREQLVRFGQLKKEDPEYDVLYNDLKSKGIFG